MVCSTVTATGAGPEDTTRATALPVTTCVPAVGVWLMMEPDGTVALDAVVIAPTVRPADVIAGRGGRLRQRHDVGHGDERRTRRHDERDSRSR
jgi:hypothetical protein